MNSFYRQILKKLKLNNKIIYLIIFILYTLCYYNLDNDPYSENEIESSILDQKILHIASSINSSISNDKLDEFKLKHLKIIRGNIQQRVVFNGLTGSGYANKMYSMLSSLVIAVLTDSALIINWKDIDKYIEEPLDFSFKKFSKNSFFNSEYQKNQLYVVKASSYAWKSKKNMERLIKSSIPLDKTRILYNSYDAYFFEICSNPKYFDKLLYYNLVKKEIIEKAINSIETFKKITEKEKQENLLQIGFEVGGNLLNRLWRPVENIRNVINHYVNNFFKGFFIIGIQFRLEFLYDDNEYSDIPTFIDCALNLEKNILKNIDNFHEKYSGFRWFISTDNEYLFAKLSSYNFRNKIIYVNKSIGIIGHIEYDTKFYLRTIIDNELLSKCDEIIITGGSTFGFLAAIKRKKEPFYINGKIKMNKCKKHNFSELSTRPPGNIITKFIGLFYALGDNASVI